MTPSRDQLRSASPIPDDIRRWEEVKTPCDFRSQRVLVTGAAGFIGSHTVEALLRYGCHVLGVDNLRTGRRENLTAVAANARFSLEECDVTEPNVLARLVAMFRPDAIIHLAALVSVQESIEQSESNFQLNLVATHLVAEAARCNGVQRVVFASSAAVYGDLSLTPLEETLPGAPISPYGAAKLASEVLLLGHAHTYRFVARCQRYFNVFGPRQDPASPYTGVITIFQRRMIEAKSVEIFGDGEQTRDFIYVRDVAEANARAALSTAVGSGTANICTGRAVSINGLWRAFHKHFPTAPQPFYRPSRSGDIRNSLGCPDRAWKELGFRASVTLEEGLEHLLAYETLGLRR
jgi:UDP-glucose 4-epimerase